MPLPHGAVGWSAVCESGFHWSYSFACVHMCFNEKRNATRIMGTILGMPEVLSPFRSIRIFLTILWVGLQCVIVALPGHRQLLF